MKAVVYTRYGLPDVLRLVDVETPAPRNNEVLVKIHAVSLNASDWEVLRGKPLYSRIAGPFRPRHHILGSDIAGRVEAVGRHATLFRPGDDVFADILSYMGGLQLAKLDNAEVTGVDNAEKLEFMRSLGADHVIDYTQEDFTRNGRTYDLILDLAGHRSAFAYQRSLVPGGRFLFVGGSMATLLQVLLIGPLIGRASGKTIRAPSLRRGSQSLAGA